jgi:hypothetical protein
VPQRGVGLDSLRAGDALLLQPDGALWIALPGLGLGYLESEWRQTAEYSGVESGLQGAICRALAPARADGFWLGGLNGTLERLTRSGSIVQADGDILGRLQNLKLLAVAEDSPGNGLGSAALSTNGAPTTHRIRRLTPRSTRCSLPVTGLSGCRRRVVVCSNVIRRPARS